MFACFGGSGADAGAARGGAAAEVARLTQEVAWLRRLLEREQEARTAAEHALGAERMRTALLEREVIAAAQAAQDMGTSLLLLAGGSNGAPPPPQGPASAASPWSAALGAGKPSPPRAGRANDVAAAPPSASRDQQRRGSGSLPTPPQAARGPAQASATDGGSSAAAAAVTPRVSEQIVEMSARLKGLATDWAHRVALMEAQAQAGQQRGAGNDRYGGGAARPGDGSGSGFGRPYSAAEAAWDAAMDQEEDDVTRFHDSPQPAPGGCAAASASASASASSSPPDAAAPRPAPGPPSGGAASPPSPIAGALGGVWNHIPDEPPCGSGRYDGAGVGALGGIDDVDPGTPECARWRAPDPVATSSPLRRSCASGPLGAARAGLSSRRGGGGGGGPGGGGSGGPGGGAPGAGAAAMPPPRPRARDDAVSKSFSAAGVGAMAGGAAEEAALRASLTSPLMAGRQSLTSLQRSVDGFKRPV
ncbi:hypothetical protein Rsub_02120 [Raphidocelis subcapitata]|uniref:Uncharacterized protein n=1 Tax=Raphidocelis subcapitata TaxID=307507 RepID=A0A2V0NUM2_9CHLO|nr:hypothetical protein Rsub_02120 [Raphidocelis subcapitata]|eukprot:GBF89243.1 hypothetical protein Rsub_02120 [Raphidocelis subcapitata]